MESSGKRTRGPNRSTPWARNPDDGVSVLRLALDTSDPLQRRRIETMFAGAYQIQRALKRGARASAKAYWAAHHERAADPAAVRDRLGLTRTGLEYAAYAHLDSAPHLRRFVTKALAMHLADSVWTGTERHLFRDGSGHRHGLPRVGRWRDFTRLPGRARSHKKPTKWETFRLHGSLAGHRAAYANARGTFTQPRRLHAVEPGDGGWWSYAGPLAVVFTGLGDGTLVLPVRLPTAPCNQPILDHHLADPTRWHKIDLVRYPAPHASGGWRYEAHLMVLTTPYVSPSATARRSSAALATMDRRTGIDVNVSNITVASHDSGRDLRVSRIARDGGATARDRSLRRRERRRQRELERSRRAMNRAQYQLSKRQQKRARRREARGLPPIEVIPMGPRLARADGAPVQSYRRDQASKTFLRNLRAAAAGAASAAQARRDRAREIAAKIVAAHGYQLVVEDTSIAAWSRSWGPCDRRVHAEHARRGDRSRGAHGRGARRCDGRCRSRVDPNHSTLSALPVWCARRQATRGPGSPLFGVRSRGRSRCSRRPARLLRAARPPRRARVRACRLRRLVRCAAPDQAGALSISGVARHPVRVNRPLCPRWIVRRVADVHTPLCRGGSANRWHGFALNPG